MNKAWQRVVRMANLIFQQAVDAGQRVAQMRRDACYDIADDHRVADESVPFVMPATTCMPGATTVKVATSSVPKMFLSNDCSFNCAYCGCRCSRDEPQRYVMPPRELARLSVEEATRNGRGVFITSAIYKSADTTQELILETVRAIREDYGYGGYVHAKVMPGADEGLIRRTGRYANRLSVNIEVAKSAGYAMVAKQKSKANILAPMRQISELVSEVRASNRAAGLATTQTTQLMAGATGEDDRVILTLARALYETYRLKRVYYTAFQYSHPAKGYDLSPIATPHWRMARLYQADRLLALYHYAPDELTPPDHAFLEPDIDPKAAWALRNLHRFPVEINTADYEALLRVPGIGITGANRILEARRCGGITHEMLARMRISLRRSAYFITCGGKFTGGRMAESPALRGVLAGQERRSALALPAGQMSFGDLDIGF